MLVGFCLSMSVASCDFWDRHLLADVWEENFFDALAVRVLDANKN